jgi:CubicO group peptidase (beta-lactamase class C family)
MRRREFVEQCGRGAFACALPPFCGAVTRRDPPEGQDAGDLRSLVDRLKHSLPQWMAEAAVPGAGIAIIADGKLAWRGSFGLSDGASRKAVDHATMYEAASMSKPAFAYVVMKLCETGLMKLDTPLTQYTPDRFLADDSRLEQITTRHVLSHTSGFQNWRSEKDPLSIHFTPGERHLYSGEGYNYLQTVVTRLQGQPFESYMKQRLLAPLGMASSGYVWNDVFARRMARPHDAKGTPLENKKSTRKPSPATGRPAHCSPHQPTSRSSSLRSLLPVPATRFTWRRPRWRKCFDRTSSWRAADTRRHGRSDGRSSTTRIVTSFTTAATTKGFTVSPLRPLPAGPVSL